MSTFSNENHVTRGFTSDAINEFAFRLLLDGFRRRFCGLMTIDDQVAMDFQKLQKRVMSGG